MYPLLLLSIAAVAIVIERLLSYRLLANPARGLLERVEAFVKQGKADEALKLSQSYEGPVAASLATILRNQNLPVADIERHVQEVGEAYFIRLERFLPILDTTTTISPLLGLLGTLFGMIRTFQAIAAAKSNGANDSILYGVGEALYATATGLSIAVVCFVAYNYFASRQKAAVSITEQSATHLINVLRDSAADARVIPEAIGA